MYLCAYANSISPTHFVSGDQFSMQGITDEILTAIVNEIMDCHACYSIH